MRSAVLALALLGLSLAPAARALDLHDPAVSQFIDQMVAQHRFQRAELEKLLAGVEFDPGIVDAMERPAEALPWPKYRRIFVTPVRISAGKIFLETQGKALAAAAQRYGVQPEIVTALIGMESFYGKHEGSHSALTALATLAFDYPRRATFFRKELAAYLVLCRQNRLDPATLQSSYAGALGAGQFMPSSYLQYAVDADGGGSDLFGDWPDIVASIAGYLAAHGWRADQPVAAPAALQTGVNAEAFLGHDVTARSLRASGVVFDAPVAATAPVRLIQVEDQDGDDEYWVGLPNFMVLMRYNHSVSYALAATQLAGAIATGPAPATAGQPLAAGHG